MTDTMTTARRWATGQLHRCAKACVTAAVAIDPDPQPLERWALALRELWPPATELYEPSDWFLDLSQTRDAAG